MVLYTRGRLTHKGQTIERSLGDRSRKAIADANTDNESKSDISIALSIAALNTSFASF